MERPFEPAREMFHIRIFPYVTPCVHLPTISVNGGAPTSLVLALLLSFTFSVHADDSSAVVQADQALLQTLHQKDRDATSRFLSPAFTWIDSAGKRLTRAQVLENIPIAANADVTPQVRVYGNSAVVRANQGKVNVLRVWQKSAQGWRALLYQEVTQVDKSEPAGGNVSGECVNPCKEIPYHPQTQSEKEAVASWQGVMKALADNDADAYSPLIAEEFVATDTFHDRPYTKADRLLQIQKQKETGKHTVPPELFSAEMFDLGESVMMIAREQRRGAKSYLNTRMWVERDGRWQLLFSFNTRIE